MVNAQDRLYRADDAQIRAQYTARAGTGEPGAGNRGGRENLSQMRSEDV